MAKQYPARKRRSKKWLVLAVVAIVLASSAVGTAYILRKPRTQTPVSDQSPTTKIDLSPATPEEKQDSNQHKEEIVNRDTGTSTGTGTDTGTSASNKKTVNVVVVSAAQVDSQIEIRSYVSGAIEDGGICKATFTKGTRSFVRQSTGIQDATTTICGRISVPVTDFAEKGSWNVKLDYSSATATGESLATSFEVN